MRKTWLFDMNSAAQATACAIVVNGGRRSNCVKFVREAPKPRTRMEELVFQGTVLELALGGFGKSAVERLARTERALRILLPDTRATGHERGIVRRTAERIEKECANALNTSAIARDLGMHPATLRRMFREAIGMSMRTVHIRARVGEAIRLFRDGWTDVLAVARQVGYKSDKNFHRAVRAVLDMTPAQMRALPSEELERLQASCCSSHLLLATN